MALLDTSVRYPWRTTDVLLRAAAHGLYRPVGSEEIIAALHRNLIRIGLLSNEQARHRAREMAAAFPEALVTNFQPLIAVMENDPKDRHVLAAAARGEAEVIVTSNLRHSPPPVLARFGIEARSPDQFLLDLLALDAPAVTDVVREQAATMRGQQPLGDVLQGLRRLVPEFGMAVTGRIASDEL